MDFFKIIINIFIDMLRSYYEILNISPNSSKAEIKRQYRKLVRMYHPDINSSFEAEEIFKEINKAAEILLDDDKRKSYDKLRAGYTDIKNSSGYAYNDLFKNKKTKRENKSIAPIKGDDITVNIKIDYMEAMLGTSRTVNIAQSSICPKCKGHKFANGIKCPYCNGLGEISTHRKINVKIPPSIKNNSKLRIKGEGKSGKFGGENGNLYVVVQIEQNEELKIKDGIVRYEASISPYTAILGGNITVPTLWGDATIKIPPLTKASQSFKLVDVGILNEKTNKKGEQIVKILIQIPNQISPEEYALYEKLREINLKKKNGKLLQS